DRAGGARAGPPRAAGVGGGGDGSPFAGGVMGFAGAFPGGIGPPDPTLLGLLEEALTVVSTGAVSLRAQLLARLSFALSLNPAAAARRGQLSEEALRLARASGDVRALARALVARHFALLGPDRIQEPRASVDQLI